LTFTIERKNGRVYGADDYIHSLNTQMKSDKA